MAGVGIGEALAQLAAPFINPFDQRNLASYVAAAIFLFVFAVGHRAVQGRKRFRARAVLRLIFRRTIWGHRSAKLDYRLYVLNMLLVAFVLGYFLVGSRFWSGVVGGGLAAAFGPPSIVAAAWGWALLAAIVQLLALDFGYWLGHLAMHRNTLLWEFHKVHHSALVMTPATEFRQHPVEMFVIPAVMAITSGTAYALCAQLLGGPAAALGQTGCNIVLAVHILTFHHLRHSHINMPFTGWLGRLLHSPGHHLIHHSANPAHFDRNMGYLLSIWDWAAGTLVLPVKGQRLTLGIGAEGAEHESVRATLWIPLRNVWRQVAQAPVARFAARKALTDR